MTGLLQDELQQESSASACAGRFTLPGWRNPSPNKRVARIARSSRNLSIRLKHNITSIRLALGRGWMLSPWGPIRVGFGLS